MWVNVASAGDRTVQGPTSKWQKAFARLKPTLVKLLVNRLKTTNPIIHSSAVIPSDWVKRINASDADVIHLHWVAGEMLSIADIGKIKKPIVWTLHDMWAFCGAEHYTEEFRWQEGYKRGNRPAYESGFDLNRWVWERKRSHWNQPLHIVSPSRWLADCVRESELMRGWPVTVVPNCLDTNKWQPLEQPLARELIGLPQGVPLLLFGSMGGGRDPRKGFDLLVQALKNLDVSIPSLELVVFGQLAPLDSVDLGFPIHYIGHLHDDLSLRALYSAADLLVVPSRQDNLPNTAVEAQACGTPVVAFDVGGLSDIIVHKETGYLSQDFDTQDMAAGVEWVLERRESGDMRLAARDRAERKFSGPVVSKQYRLVYATEIAGNN
jgi:glycosyltransferase involved in cell wall biosynthesis